jgi:hypothetical protein
MGSRPSGSIPDGLSNRPAVAIAGSTAIVSKAWPPCGEECENAQWQLPPDEPVEWDLTSGRTSRFQACGPLRALSRYGRAPACLLAEHGDEQVLLSFRMVSASRESVFTFQTNTVKCWPPRRANRHQQP